MNAYLVLLRHGCDDLPIALCATKAEAARIARRTKAEPTRHARDLFNANPHTPVGVAVVTFRDGEPIDCEYIKHF